MLLLHQRRWAAVMSFYGDRHMTDDVFVKLHQAAHFQNGAWVRFDVHQNIVAFFIFLNGISKIAKTNKLSFRNLSAFIANKFNKVLRQCFNLSSCNVLTYNKYTFV